MENILNFIRIDTTILTKNLIASGGIILGTIVVRIIAGFFIRSLIRRVGDNDPDTNTAIEQRAYTLGGLGKNIVNVFVYGIAAVMILSKWGLDIAPLLTGAGILGLAIGFGAQTLVKDIVNGFFIIFENQYNVGDKVKIGDFEGRVKEIKLRTTELRGDSGEKYIIPNSTITSIEIIK